MNRLTGLLLAMVMTAGASVPAQADEVIYEKKSLYRNISVIDRGDRICMLFSTVRRVETQQSCQYKDDPDELVFDYAKMVMAGLLLNPEPERILIAGLGGGSIPDALHKLYPDARIDTVEIDPAVVKVAREYFDFRETDNMKVYVQDARVFVKRALHEGRQYDFVLLDAFNGDYIPEHLMTKDFLLEVRRLLSDRGVLVANTFSSSRLYSNESVTYAAAFGWFLNLKKPHTNRVIVTRKGPELTRDEVIDRAASWERDMERFGVDMFRMAHRIQKEPDWNREAKVLTDQFAPVNLLNGNSPVGRPGDR